MGKPQIPASSLAAARQIMNEHLANVKNPHDVDSFQTGAIRPDHTHTKNGLPASVIFTRASTVPWRGNTLAVNIPRQDLLDGTLVEEGTTNLLPTGAEDFVTGWETYEGSTATVTPNQPDPVGGYNAYRIQITGGTSGLKYSIASAAGISSNSYIASVWAQANSGTAGISCQQDASATQKINSTSWQRVFSPVITGNNYRKGLSFIAADANSGIDITVYMPQCEAKPYATSYTPPGTTRANESLTIPNNVVDLGGGNWDYSRAVLNPTQGTIEIDFVVDSKVHNAGSPFSIVFAISDTDERNQLSLRKMTYDARWYFVVGDSLGNSTINIGTLSDGVHKCKITYKDTTYLWMDGVCVGSNNLSPTTFANSVGSCLWIGSWLDQYYPLNTFIKSIRISSIARTDTEMAYTGKPVLDKATTFLSTLTGNGGQVSHNDLVDTGTNTHAQIDAGIVAMTAHMNSGTNPHSTTAAQVGAVPICSATQVSAGFNTFTASGHYLVAAAQTNAPEATYAYFLEVIAPYGVTTYIIQRATRYGYNVVYQRVCNNGTWSSWGQIYPAVLT